MDSELRILFVEDSVPDYELEERELRRGGLKFVCSRVQTRDELKEALKELNPDLVISDYSLPDMGGLEVLRIVREACPAVPFIFVSGTIGEERAIDSLKNGATDYVVKNRLAGLPVRIDRALKEAKERDKHTRLEAQLRQAQKMEAIGRLAGGIAHDFNNLLTAINGYSQLVLGRLPKSDVNCADIEEVLRAGERAALLTRQLLAFSRKQLMAPVVLNLNKVVNDIERMLLRTIGEDIELVTVLDPHLGNVKADPGHVEQVLMNLSVNARDAMPNGGKLTLETANVKLDETFAKEHSEAKAGPYVLLSVSDTGIGMDKEIQAHLFEPFFTTKGPGQGTGLGLSTAYGIVQQSGGTICVYSDPGQGATFKVYLPRVDQPLDTPKRPEAMQPLPMGTETILLVEDSDPVRKLMNDVLVKGGYRVLVAEDGEAALRIVQGNPSPIELLITDVVLPRMGGKEVALHVLRSRPGIKILYTSGYTDRGIVESNVLDPGTAFLQKPFTPEDLLRKTRETLGTSPSRR